MGSYLWGSSRQSVSGVVVGPDLCLVILIFLWCVVVVVIIVVFFLCPLVDDRVSVMLVIFFVVWMVGIFYFIVRGFHYVREEGDEFEECFYGNLCRVEIFVVS